MIAAYYKHLTADDKKKQLECAKAWSLWEGSVLSVWPDYERRANHLDDDFALSFARIECHYFFNGGFFDIDDQIIRNLDRVNHIPAVLIQGRYDICTPVQTAWDIHKKWPQADYKLVHDAGHTATEPGITHELLEATDRFRN